MGRILGIDLGTTNSVVAILDGPQPRVLENRENRAQTRSAVGLRKRRGKADDAAGEVLVGDTAIDNWPLATKDTIISIKRLMGRRLDDPEVERVRQWALYDIVKPTHGTRDSLRVMMGGREYSPIEISAIILEKLKKDAEFRLGEPVTHAVITVPAYFSQIQRDATRTAGLMAGLKVIKILDEPTAAAIAFATQASQQEPKTVLVYDLGGGTFDISILVCSGNAFATLNVEGDMWLGGDNFDALVVESIVERVRQEHGLNPRSNLRFMAELKRAAQAVKERLSSAATADLIVPGLLQDKDGNLIDIDMEITRAEFERMILPLVGRYRQCTSGHVTALADARCATCGEPVDGRPIREGRALELTRKALAHPSVNLTPDQVDYVLMAGNATSTPVIQRTMDEVFGAVKVVRKTHPKHAVALGAAIVASWIGERTVCQAPDPQDSGRECGQQNDSDALSCKRCGAPLVLSQPRESTLDTPVPIGAVGEVASFSYGTQTAGDTYNVFIHKGDPFPTQNPVVQVFRTRVPRQRMVSIPVYGGDILERASANQKQGEAFAVLPPDLPQGTPVRVKLWLNRDGIFDLSALLDDGTDLRPWIVKGEGDARAIEAIERVEKALEKEPDLPSVVRANVEAGRNRVFDELRNRDFDAAFKEADAAQAHIDRAKAAPQPASLPAEAEGLLRWTEFVLARYGWAFEQTVVYRLQGLCGALRAALDSGAPNLGREYTALDNATQTIPAVVARCLNLRVAIRGRIQPHNPARSAALIERMERIEAMFPTNYTVAAADLESLAKEVTGDIEAIGRQSEQRCSHGHVVPRGERHCKHCGEDTWSLDAAGAGRSQARAARV